MAGKRFQNWWTIYYAVKFCKDLFNETLDYLTEKQFIKCNIISNWECLSLPKDSEFHHRSIQSTQEDSSVHEHLNPCSSVHEHLNPCPPLDSGTNRKSFLFKEELETFKIQVISKIKNLIFKEICFKRSYHHAFQHWCTFRKSSNSGILSRAALFHEWRIKKQTVWSFLCYINYINRVHNIPR